MPGAGMKRKQLRQLSLSNCFKKKAEVAEDMERSDEPTSSRHTEEKRKSEVIKSVMDSPGASKDESDSPSMESAVAGDGLEAAGLHSPPQPMADSPMTEDEEREDDGGISDTVSKSGSISETCSWKGLPIEELTSSYTLPGPLKPSADHTIFFRPHIDPDRPPRPFPDSYRDGYDEDHLLMPCAARCRITDERDGNPRRRWDVVEQALKEKLTTAGDIQEAILSYNQRMANSWRFETLHALLHEEMSGEEAKFFFNALLPRMVSAALNLPNLVTAPIPILRAGRNHSISFSQQQISCLLANAFFCTFLHRSGRQGGPDIPGANFFSLFCAPVSTRKFEKLRSLLHYFRRVLIDEVPSGTVTFTRRCIDGDALPNWSRLSSPLPAKLHVTSDGTIEDQGFDMLQVDFANKRIGGGVLRNGSVQEEIRFVICPEMIISRLFTETMEKNEALVIVGAERFSNYSGYANTYKWAGDYRDCTMRDTWGRRRTCLVAIDATRFNRTQEQFVPGALKRELDKAFVGFEWEQLPRSVATGNWGCGAFRGNHELKALLQMMACSAAQCNICYFTFGDTELRDNIVDIHRLLTEHKLLVKDVWRLICRYWKECVNDKRAPTETLYKYIHRTLKDNTDTS